MLLRNGQTVKALLSIVSMAKSQLPAQGMIDDALAAALNTPPHVVCARFAIMTLVSLGVCCMLCLWCDLHSL